MGWIYAFIVSIALFIPSFAKAAPYIGMDVQWRAISIKGLESNIFSKRARALNFHSGVMINDDCSIEAGFHSAKSNKNSASVKMKGIHGSLIRHFPLNEEKTIHALGGLGLVQLKHSAKHPTYRLDLSRRVPRAIAGAEYSFTPSLRLRLAFIWEASKGLQAKADRFRNTYALNTGLRFSF